MGWRELGACPSGGSGIKRALEWFWRQLEAELEVEIELRYGSHGDRKESLGQKFPFTLGA